MAAFDETAVHHCEVVNDEAHGGPNSNWYHCKNQSRHKHFLTVEEFGMEHLPPKYRTQKVMDGIQTRIDRTVKITVSYTSEKRPDTFPDSPMPYPFREHRGSNQHPRCGTGYIVCVSRTPFTCGCPCPECVESNQPKMEYWEVKVLTATHVVFDDSEAKSVVVDLFYNNENREGVRHLYGLHNNDRLRYETDRSEIVCVTHETDLMGRLTGICEDGKRFSSFFDVGDENIAIMVSHPHGVSKKLSIGKPLEKNCFVKPGCSITIPKWIRVSFQKNGNTQEDTQHSDLEGNNDTLRLFSQNTGDQNSKTKVDVNQQETVTSKSLEDFSSFLTPNTNEEVVKLKVGLEAFPSPASLIVVDGTYNSHWHTFPADTKYVSTDGRSVVVPTEIKFHLNHYNDFVTYSFDYFLTYDMATCPGCSGAFVGLKDIFNIPWTHYGICRGKGQSGLSPYFYYKFLKQ